jgi:iduronate 2-sulfatase
MAKSITLSFLLRLAAVLLVPTTVVLADREDGGYTPRRFNILHVFADDHRTELRPYIPFEPAVNPNIITPNLAQFASTATTMANAFCNSPFCATSRGSQLVSRRPKSTGIKSFLDGPVILRNSINATTMPQYLKEQGYQTYGMGKIFHSVPFMPLGVGDDNQYSWTEPVYQPHNYREYFQETLGDPFNSSFVVDDLAVTCEDLIASRASEVITQFAQDTDPQKAPLYVAVGFYRPHLPFWADEATYELYPEDEVMMPEYPYVPENYPPTAWAGYVAELSFYQDIQRYLFSQGQPPVPYNTTLPDAMMRRLRRAYYAAVTGTDTLFGKLIQTLEENDMEDDTIIIYQSDHGFLLGEHGEWSKFRSFDLSIRVPFIIRVPGMNQRREVESIVELVDVFPTLVDILGLPELPVCPEDNKHIPLCTEGKSFKGLIEYTPSINGRVQSWRKPSFSGVTINVPPYLYAWECVRDENYKYVRYMDYNTTTNDPIFDALRGEELYDYNVNLNETINFADDTRYRLVKKAMIRELQKGWRKYVDPSA